MASKFTSSQLRRYNTPQVKGWVRGWMRVTKSGHTEADYEAALQEFINREVLYESGVDANEAFKYAPPGEDSEDYWEDNNPIEFHSGADEPEYVRKYMYKTGPIHLNEGMTRIFNERFVKISGRAKARQYKDTQRGVIVSYRTYRAYKRMYAGQ